MTRIRASCPECGEVDLRPDEVTLHVVRGGDGALSIGSSYRFLCPACDELVTKPADERIATLLRSGGVATEETAGTGADRRPRHPEDPPGGPPLGYDDLLDLHLLLAGDDWFARLLAHAR